MAYWDFAGESVFATYLGRLQEHLARFLTVAGVTLAPVSLLHHLLSQGLVTDPASFAQSPFAMLSFIAATALLTNASCVLAQSTTNRWLETRNAMKRSLAESEKHGLQQQVAEHNKDHADRLDFQAGLLLDALTSIYLALGAIAGATLVTLVGAAFVSFQGALWYYCLAFLGLVLGALGVGSLIFGSIRLFQTTRISLSDIHQDAMVIRERQIKQ